MAYLGRQPVLGNFVKLDAITVVNGQAAYTMQNGGVNFTSYDNVNQFLVSLNGILQSPTDSFTVSGSTLTFASNLSTGDVIDFVMVLGNTLDIGTPSDNTVSLAKLTATGTKDATTFLRGDNTFASAGGANTPAFYVRASTDQTISNDTTTIVVFDFENFDTNNAFSSNTFTVPSGEAGKYFFYTNVSYINPNSTGYRILYFYKNSTQYMELQRLTDDTARNNYNLSTIMDLSVGDTVTVRVVQTSGTDMTLNRIGSTDKNGIHFGGFKIIE